MSEVTMLLASQLSNVESSAIKSIQATRQINKLDLYHQNLAMKNITGIKPLLRKNPQRSNQTRTHHFVNDMIGYS